MNNFEVFNNLMKASLFCFCFMFSKSAYILCLYIVVLYNINSTSFGSVNKLIIYHKMSVLFLKHAFRLQKIEIEKSKICAKYMWDIPCTFSLKSIVHIFIIVIGHKQIDINSITLIDIVLQFKVCPAIFICWHVYS